MAVSKSNGGRIDGLIWFRSRLKSGRYRARRVNGRFRPKTDFSEDRLLISAIGQRESLESALTSQTLGVSRISR
jgi:hypothetical protein